MTPYKCINCGEQIFAKRGLCRKCADDAAELDRQVYRKTEEEQLAELEKKPRSWRDVFYGRATK